MKNLTAELKARSVKKWRVISRAIRMQAVGNYGARYWNPCGFCVAAGHCDSGINCEACSLYDGRRDTSVCFRVGWGTHGYSAIRFADCRDWPQAAHHAAIVLAAIEAAEVEEK